MFFSPFSSSLLNLAIKPQAQQPQHPAHIHPMLEGKGLCLNLRAQHFVFVCLRLPVSFHMKLIDLELDSAH